MDEEIQDVKNWIACLQTKNEIMHTALILLLHMSPARDQIHEQFVSVWQEIRAGLGANPSDEMLETVKGAIDKLSAAFGKPIF